MEWYKDISAYLQIPESEIIKALGSLTGHSQEDKILFSQKYDSGKRIVSTINRKAEIEGNLTEAWSNLKYIAIRQEYASFQRRDFIRSQIIPKIEYLISLRTDKDPPYVLDYGCGTSLFGRLLLKEHPHYHLTLCDVNGYHFKFAVLECKKLATQIDSLIIESDNHVPSFSKNFDFIYCYAVFEHIPNILDVIKALKNSLNKNGFLLETYAGETGKKPNNDSADSEKSWASRDDYFKFMLNNFKLIDGNIPDKNEQSHYKNDSNYRIWEIYKKSHICR